MEPVIVGIVAGIIIGVSLGIALADMLNNPWDDDDCDY